MAEKKERTPLELRRLDARMHTASQIHHRARMEHVLYGALHRRMAILHQKHARLAFIDVQHLTQPDPSAAHGAASPSAEARRTSRNCGPAGDTSPAGPDFHGTSDT